MELNMSFLTGFFAGTALGVSLFALRKYLGFCSYNKTMVDTFKAVKQYGSNSDYKVVLVVRTDLNMGKGKIAAQCSHAAVGVFEKAQKKDPEGLQCWQLSGQAKIALKTDSLEEINKILANAKKLGLITSLIRDAGRTQIAANSVTVLGVGPAPKDVIDQVTGHLKLL